MAQLEEALKRLVEDARFRDAVVADPDRLTREYGQLQTNEILLLLQVWHASGDPAAARMIWLCHCCCGFTTTPRREDRE